MCLAPISPIVTCHASPTLRSAVAKHCLFLASASVISNRFDWVNENKTVPLLVPCPARSSSDKWNTVDKTNPLKWKSVHGETFSWDMYCKWGCPQEAAKCFGEIPRLWKKRLPISVKYHTVVGLVVFQVQFAPIYICVREAAVHYWGLEACTSGKLSWLFTQVNKDSLIMVYRKVVDKKPLWAFP